MFGLLTNLYRWAKKKSERRIALVLLGLDNAGKTSVFNALNGEADKDTTPSFGFTRSTLKEGKYTIDLYDLGGGKNIRRIWNTYLPEIHGAVYVVDASDAARFPESKQVLQTLLTDKNLHSKPILVLANKQDLPTASSAHEVASALGLHECLQNQYNIRPTCAKLQPFEDSNLHRNIAESFKWLVDAVDTKYSTLAPRVLADAEAHRQEELQKKREREERARKMKEERLRQEAAEQQQLQQPGSPQQELAARSVSLLQAAPPGPADNFVDLEKAEAPGRAVVTASALTEPDNARRPLLSPLLPPSNRVTPVIATP